MDYVFPAAKYKVIRLCKGKKSTGELLEEVQAYKYPGETRKAI